MSDTFLEKAGKVLSEAVNLDKFGNLNDALIKYTEGVQLLIRHRKTLPEEDPKRKLLNGKVLQYLDRAEAIKSEIKIEVQVLEQRRIKADSIGHSYESVFGKCLDENLTAVHVQDAYICANHQVINFVRFCELLVKMAPNIKLINLVTGTDAKSNDGSFKELTASLQQREVKLKITFNPDLHDREIRFNNGWIVKIGRGLDYFKRVDRFSIGFFDMSLRPCHETIIDTFRVKQQK